MPTRNKGGRSPIDRLRRRYERTETKCPECGYVDEDNEWRSRTDGRRIVYQHVCPSCDAEREYTFRMDR
ncbi:MAG: HVO_0649 family zinc finger protein [Haloarculaceae archaeon]